jgi:hypothetical protein
MAPILTTGTFTLFFERRYSKFSSFSSSRCPRRTRKGGREKYSVNTFYSLKGVEYHCMY